MIFFHAFIKMDLSSFRPISFDKAISLMTFCDFISLKL
jgi:hypothetical protein